MNSDRRDVDRTALKGWTDSELRAALEFQRQAHGGEPA
jgi:hypothetical protein